MSKGASASETIRVIEIIVSPQGEISIQTRNLLAKPADSGSTVFVQAMPNGSLRLTVSDKPRGKPT